MSKIKNYNLVIGLIVFTQRDDAVVIITVINPFFKGDASFATVYCPRYLGLVTAAKAKIFLCGL